MKNAVGHLVSKRIVKKPSRVSPASMSVGPHHEQIGAEQFRFGDRELGWVGRRSVRMGGKTLP
jgi:hypothetical protein